MPEFNRQHTNIASFFEKSNRFRLVSAKIGFRLVSAKIGLRLAGRIMAAAGQGGCPLNVFCEKNL
jgi:hypothetical protein